MITQVPIRAKVSGAGISAETPDVLSFNITQSRGALDSFSCSVRVKTPSSGSGKLNISCGALSYTGVITASKARPCFEDPDYTIIDFSGTDERINLQNKKFTRRQVTSLTSWALITGVVRKGLKSSKLNYTPKSNAGGGYILSPDSIYGGQLSDGKHSKDILKNNSRPSMGRGKGQSDGGVEVTIMPGG